MLKLIKFNQFKRRIEGLHFFFDPSFFFLIILQISMILFIKSRILTIIYYAIHLLKSLCFLFKNKHLLIYSSFAGSRLQDTGASYSWYTGAPPYTIYHTSGPRYSVVKLYESTIATPLLGSPIALTRFRRRYKC